MNAAPSWVSVRCARTLFVGERLPRRHRGGRRRSGRYVCACPARRRHASRSAADARGPRRRACDPRRRARVVGSPLTDSLGHTQGIRLPVPPPHLAGRELLCALVVRLGEAVPLFGDGVALLGVAVPQLRGLERSAPVCDRRDGASRWAGPPHAPARGPARRPGAPSRSNLQRHELEVGDGLVAVGTHFLVSGPTFASPCRILTGRHQEPSRRYQKPYRRHRKPYSSGLDVRLLVLFVFVDADPLVVAC